jgi:hypothetical protein
MDLYDLLRALREADGLTMDVSMNFPWLCEDFMNIKLKEG